jgi:O-antigen ligase
MAVRLGVKMPEDMFIVPLEGYANNSNAFAFQLVVLTAATLVARDLGLFTRRNLWPVVILALAGASIYFATSRAGLVMFALALALYVALSPQRKSALGLLLRSVALAYAIVLAGLYAPELTGAHVPGTPVSLGFDPLPSDTKSDSERWSTIAEGYDMWLASPVFGNGLGAYIRAVLAEGRDMIVIHSTPVWVLAEMGVVGLVLVGAAFLSLLWVAVGLMRRPESRAWGMGGVILLVSVGAGNMVHDLFFQRSFWFLLGLCLAGIGAGARLGLSGRTGARGPRQADARGGLAAERRPTTAGRSGRWPGTGPSRRPAP